jgi:molybdopterin biosynthesis enzyme
LKSLIQVLSAVYIDTGSPVPNIPSKLRGLEDENNKLIIIQKELKKSFYIVSFLPQNHWDILIISL